MRMLMNVRISSTITTTCTTFLTRSLLRAFAWLSMAALGALGCARPSAHPASPTQPAVDVVRAHLRACERGDWDEALTYLSDDYGMRMEGMPFFVPSIKRDKALDVHKARKRAFPDFKFNERVLSSDGTEVKIAVYLSGTHTGFLDYPVGDVPKLEPTGRTIDLPAEYFTYTVENGRIVRTRGRIPDGHGPAALKKQLGVR